MTNKKIVTVEDGTIIGGLGSAVIDFMSEKGYSARIKKLGIPDGIALLKDMVNHYIDHERAEVLKKRCDALVANIRLYAGDVLVRLEPIYGEVDTSDIEEDDLLGDTGGRHDDPPVHW